MSLSCGKRKPPIPPKERVQQRVEISGFQRGNQVVLSWKMPARNVGKGSVLNISRADIYRLAEPLGVPTAITEEDFASRSTLVATVPIGEEDFGLKTMRYSDTLQFAGQAARLRYAIRFVNAQGQKAAFSNFLLLEPAARVAATPTSLSAEPSQEAMILKWIAPSANIDGTTPANIVGYNVYRSPSEKETAKLLNSSPVTSTEYRDEFFEFDKKYFYFVRTVSVGTGGDPIESGESDIVNVKAQDTFAPSAPSSITLAATPTTISIFFAANPEKDIKGYNVYRSADENLPKDKWELLTTEPLPTNTYQDSKVEAGKKYFYYLTAIDKAGNISETSEVVSETVP
ncbi:MAG TPA: hypothetical protein VJL58_11155 [Pyrinomonadaceae bacterium]|nr:hypothetical protein [Pyrinomonadaceae bacterium]